MQPGQESKIRELASLKLHPGWKHVEEYILGSQSMLINETSQKGFSSEDTMKNIGGFNALRRFIGWMEYSSKVQKDSEV